MGRDEIHPRAGSVREDLLGELQLVAGQRGPVVLHEGCAGCYPIGP